MKRRPDVESRVLVQALKQSLDTGDRQGALLAYRQLSLILKQAESSSKLEEFKRTIDRQATESDTAREDMVEPMPQIETPGINAQVIEKSHPAEPGAKDDFKARDPFIVQGSQLPTALPPEQPLEKGQDKAVEKTLYELFGKNELSSFEEIHIEFLRSVFKLLLAQAKSNLNLRDFRQELRTLCIAHDILKDPVTRTDYDFRRMGVRHENHLQTPEDEPAKQLGNRTALKIGELLECSKILELSELEIAVDMHKAMPEMMFGQFLVKQGFLTFDELDSALLGQRLLVDGKITVGQFQIAMSSVKEKGLSLEQVIMSNNWMDSLDIEPYLQFESTRNEAGTLEMLPVFIEPAVSRTFSPPPPISVNNAVPSWAAQLSWDEPAGDDFTLPQSIVERNLDLDPEQAIAQAVTSETGTAQIESTPASCQDFACKAPEPIAEIDSPHTPSPGPDLVTLPPILGSFEPEPPLSQAMKSSRKKKKKKKK